MTSDTTTKTKNCLEYTNVQRRSETGGKKKAKFHREQQKTVKDLEEKLNRGNSRSSNIETLKLYLTARFSVQTELYNHYRDVRFRMYNWWSYTGKQKSEAKLIRNIKEKFGEDIVVKSEDKLNRNINKKTGENIVLAYGSWKEASSMRGLMPSPTSSMTRLLSKHFAVLIVPEYNTSKTCSRCESEIDMISPGKTPDPRPWKKGKNQEIRGLRRCQNVECSCLWSRDYNAAINIGNNFRNALSHQQWDPLFASPRPKTLRTSTKDVPLELAVF